jgi:hypothetical protein
MALHDAPCRAGVFLAFGAPAGESKSRAARPALPRRFRAGTGASSRGGPHA